MLGIVVHHVLHENFGRFVKNVILANSLKTLSPDPFSFAVLSVAHLERFISEKLE